MPVVTIGQNTADDFSGCEDALLDDNSPNTNFSSGTTLTVEDTFQIPILRFTGLSNIPTDATINAVTLHFNVASVAFVGGGAVMNFYEVLRDWIVGQVTYNSYTTGNGWGTPGALDASDIDTTPAHTETCNNTTGPDSYSGAGLTALVAGWVAAPSTNEGIACRTTGTYFAWSSSEDTDGLRPYLEVDYTASGGPTSYYLSDTVEM